MGVWRYSLYGWWRKKDGEQVHFDRARKGQHYAERHEIGIRMIRITEDDFFVGLFAALAGRGFRLFSLRNDQFEKAVAKVFDKLKRKAVKEGYDLRFIIRLEDFHNDSIVIRDAVATAASNGIVSLDNPVYQDIRLKISRDESDVFLKTVPGGKALYDELSKEFEKSYCS